MAYAAAVPMWDATQLAYQHQGQQSPYIASVANAPRGGSQCHSSYVSYSWQGVPDMYSSQSYSLGSHQHKAYAVPPTAFSVVPGAASTMPSYDDIWRANAARAAAGPFKFYAEQLPQQQASEFRAVDILEESTTAGTVEESAEEERSEPEEEDNGDDEADRQQYEAKSAEEHSRADEKACKMTPEVYAKEMRGVDDAKLAAACQPAEAVSPTEPIFPSDPTSWVEVICQPQLARGGLDADAATAPKSIPDADNIAGKPLIIVRDYDKLGFASPMAGSLQHQPQDIAIDQAQPRGRRPSHLQISTCHDDLSLTPSPSTRPASTTSLDAEAVFEPQVSESLMALSSPSRASDVVPAEELAEVCIPQHSHLTNRDQYVQEKPALMVGRGIVRSYPFDSNGMEAQQNVFELFSAKMPLEGAAAPEEEADANPSQNKEQEEREEQKQQQETSPPTAGSNWSFGTPMYRTPVAASPSHDSMDSWSLTSPASAKDGPCSPAAALSDDDGASQATLPAPVLERTQPNEVMAVAPLKSEGATADDDDCAVAREASSPLDSKQHQSPTASSLLAAELFREDPAPVAQLPLPEPTEPGTQAVDGNAAANDQNLTVVDSPPKPHLPVERTTLDLEVAALSVFGDDSDISDNRFPLPPPLPQDRAFQTIWTGRGAPHSQPALQAPEASSESLPSASTSSRVAGSDPAPAPHQGEVGIDAERPQPLVRSSSSNAAGAMTALAHEAKEATAASSSTARGASRGTGCTRLSRSRGSSNGSSSGSSSREKTPSRLRRAKESIKRTLHLGSH